MKKMVLAMLIAILCAAPALAESLPNAHAICDVSVLERYAGFEMDDESGEWYVHAQETEALLNYLPKAVADLNEFGLCYFSLGGNAKTGMLWLDMNVLYHQNSKRINAISASIRLGDDRYDMVLQPQETPVVGTEVYSVRLGREGYDLLLALAAAEKFSMEIVGDYVYARDFELQDKENAQAYLANFSVRGLQGAWNIAEVIGADQYALWDLSVRETQLRKSQRSEDERLNEYFGEKDRLCIKSNGNGVKAYQTLLREKGYLAGKVDSSFGISVQQATRNVQRFAGLLETGCADPETLLYLLEGKTPSMESSEKEPAYTIETDQYALRLDRFWYAPSFEASSAQDWLAVRECENADNMLLIIEGELQNRADEELYLPSALPVEVSVNGAKLPVETLVEANAGRSFENILGASQCKRMILFVEIAKNMAEENVQIRLHE